MIRVAGYIVLFLFGLAAVPAAQAVPVSFVAHLDGASESPPVASPGTGLSYVDFDTDASTMRVRASFTDLVGTTTIAHIHGPVVVPGGTAGVLTTLPTFPGFPAGVTGGNYDMTFDMTLASSYSSGFLSMFGNDTGLAEAALFDILRAGTAYFNIHTTAFPGGEIRGFLSAVPEPATFGLVLVALIWMVGRRRQPRAIGV